MKVGVVGFGELGRFLVEKILVEKDGRIELVFVWNRTASKIKECSFVDPKLILENLDDFASYKADLIVEVAHPLITEQYASKFLEHCDYYLGSPTVMADVKIEQTIMNAVKQHAHSLYIPVGALWGANDIAKMAERGTLKALTISMAKHPSAFKLCGELEPKLQEAAKVLDKEVVLYDGPCRQLCPMAPNNVNTIACAALAGIGFDRTRAILISDARLQTHEITIDVEGPYSAAQSCAFRCTTRRSNPAAPGAVTGQVYNVTPYQPIPCSNWQIALMRD